MATRILLLRPGAIGDTLVTMPALLALRKRYAAAQIEMAGNPAALPLLASSALVDRCLTFDDPRVMRLFVSGEPASDDPFRGIDVAVAWCADADEVLARGLAARGATEAIVTPSRPPPGQSIHVARHLVETLGPLGIELADPLVVPPMHASTGGERRAREELLALGLEGRAFVAVHPGSGSPAKNWPAERFAAVVDALQNRCGLPSLIFGGPADEEALARLGGATRTRPLILLDRPLPVVAAMLQRARAFLGNDSGLSHLAGLLGVPTVALFGPSDPALWSPLGPRVRVIRSEPLAKLEVGDVVGELRALLAGRA